MIQEDELNLIMIKYGNDFICVSLIFMDQPVGLIRDIIMKASDGNI